MIHQSKALTQRMIMPPPPPRKPRSNVDSFPICGVEKLDDDVRWRKEPYKEPQTFPTTQESEDLSMDSNCNTNEYEESVNLNCEESIEVNNCYSNSAIPSFSIFGCQFNFDATG